MYKSPGNDGRKFRTIKGGKFPSKKDSAMTDAALIPSEPPALTYDEVLSTYRQCVVVDLGEERSARKRLATIQDCNPRTAKGHYEGQNLPGVVEFLRACQRLPTLKAWVREVLQLQADLDPRFEREMHNLIRTYQEMTEARK